MFEYMSLSAVRFSLPCIPRVEIHGVMACIFKVTDVCYHVVVTRPPVWKVCFITPLPALAISDFLVKRAMIEAYAR